MIAKIIKAIESRGVLTGSRALWGVTAESDWDYILESEDFDKIHEKLESLNYELEEVRDYKFSLTGVYFTYEGKKYNLINCTPEQFIAWETVLKMMLCIPAEYHEKIDKAKRKELYERFVGIFEYEVQGVKE